MLNTANKQLNQKLPEVLSFFASNIAALLFHKKTGLSLNFILGHYWDFSVGWEKTETFL